jgi:hypothetical protein
VEFLLHARTGPGGARPQVSELLDGALAEVGGA